MGNGRWEVNQKNIYLLGQGGVPRLLSFAKPPYAEPILQTWKQRPTHPKTHREGVAGLPFHLTLVKGS